MARVPVVGVADGVLEEVGGDGGRVVGQDVGVLRQPAQLPAVSALHRRQDVFGDLLQRRTARHQCQSRVSMPDDPHRAGDRRVKGLFQQAVAELQTLTSRLKDISLDRLLQRRHDLSDRPAKDVRQIGH